MLKGRQLFDIRRSVFQKLELFIFIFKYFIKFLFVKDLKTSSKNCFFGVREKDIKYLLHNFFEFVKKAVMTFPWCWNIYTVMPNDQ